FNGADIRSARFLDANLQKVTFCHAYGGLQRRWVGAQFCLIIVIAVLAGFLQGYSSGLLGYYLQRGIEGETDFLIAAMAGIFLVAVTFFAIARQGFTVKALGSMSVAVADFFLSLYINHRIRQHDPKFVNLRIIGLAFAALGGTTFSGADLTKASFAHATLKHLNLADSSQRSTILIQVRWHHVQELNRARLGTSNLQDPRVRHLLVTLKGANQDFSGADLRGTNLAGAELHGANLTEAQCIGTDFTQAQLTGACLEGWNIDETTILKDVDCDYVFLKEQPDRYGNRERRPHNPDKIFQPGDFEKFFKEMLDTVQILIRQGIHPQVFKEALAQLMTNYDLPDDAVQGFEKKGEDVLVTIAVPTDTDKGQFEQAFDELQALKLEAARTQGLLAGERKRADTLEAILLKPGSTTNTF
ncbi:MAG: pentapeptide repeat-containing protein, partial [Cyanobacteria bacterium P01_C01_bin.147]